jgi:hypothetical protein
LVWLDVKAHDAAVYVRRFLRHPQFNTIASRMGVVARVHNIGIHYWQREVRALQSAPWQTP